MVSQKLKTYYCVVLSQTTSEDGKYLFVGTNFGDILVFPIEQLTSDGNGDNINEINIETANIGSHTKAVQIFSVEKSQIYSLSYYNDFLIVGTNSEISGYTFKGQQIGKKAWEVRIPSTPENTELNEVNYLWLDKENGHLYAGCGDNNIYSISLEDGKILRTFSGHTNYIHCLDGNSSMGQIVSASEDGTVRMWDIRQKKSSGKLEPHRKEQLNRPEHGKWQGTVSFNDDWLVCGGGPRFSMWHLRMNELTTVLDFPDKVHISGFLDDMIMVGGDHKTVQQYNFNGNLVNELYISSPSIYSAVWQTSSNKILCLGGSSNVLDVCTDFNYRDYSLQLYSNEQCNK